MRNKAYCCEDIKETLTTKTEKGFHIHGFKRGEKRIYMLAYLACDLSNLQAALENAKTDLSPISQQAISNCPWCGSKLDRFYKNKLEIIQNKDLVSLLPQWFTQG
ncbi:MAG: hypothetical protein CSA81_01255 [Acidobacteria bacterium]|nr:MAG: hypothetical protein CSA81_01255 [Acidobacteriota bacterium]